MRLIALHIEGNQRGKENKDHHKLPEFWGTPGARVTNCEGEINELISISSFFSYVIPGHSWSASNNPSDSADFA